MVAGEFDSYVSASGVWYGMDLVPVLLGGGEGDGLEEVELSSVQHQVMTGCKHVPQARLEEALRQALLRIQ